MQMKVLEESLGAEVLLSKGFWLDYSNAPRGIYSRFKLEVSVTMMHCEHQVEIGHYKAIEH